MLLYITPPSQLCLARPPELRAFVRATNEMTTCALANVMAGVTGFSAGMGEVSQTLQSARAAWCPTLGFLAAVAALAAVFT
ncbi:MAG: hypothetical protein AABM40_04415 [Chloroflexota bacterium]